MNSTEQVVEEERDRPYLLGTSETDCCPEKCSCTETYDYSEKSDDLRTTNSIDEFIAKCLTESEDIIIITPETNTDVTYLQNEVNKLRHQLATAHNKSKSNKRAEDYTDKDIDTCNIIVIERNILQDLQSKRTEAVNRSASLTNSLHSQSEYIDNMEATYRQMQEFYRERFYDCMTLRQTHEMQMKEMKNELCADMQRIEKLKLENNSLRKEIMQKDMTICNYEILCKQIKFKAKLYQMLSSPMENSDLQSCNKE